MSAPNAGITITSSALSGGPYANGEIKVVTNKAAYGTQWHPYHGTPPASPIWHGTTTGPGNPFAVAPTSYLVVLKANQPVNFSANPVSVTVVAGYRTRIAVVYP